MSTVPILVSTETISRELDAQMLIASTYVRPGVRFYFGQTASLRIAASHMRNGIAFGKVVDPLFPGGDQAYFTQLKRSGFSAVHLDEEGAVYPGREPRWRAVLRRRLDVNFLSPEDHVCTWGTFQRDTYASERASLAEHVHATGHPRFDLYSPTLRSYFDEDVAALRARYGDFVLFNTNLSWANHGAGLSTVFSARTGFDASSPQKRIDHMEYWAYASKVIVGIVKLANRMSIEFPQMKVVIRPHPSEDLGYYQTIFRDVPNVVVVREGSVAPWLLAARALVHDGCTTAIEGYLGGVHVLNFRAVSDAKHERFLPSQFGVPCKTEDDVVEWMRAILAGERSAQNVADVDAVGASLLQNLSEPSMPNIVRVLDQSMAARKGEAHIDEAALATHVLGAETVRVAKAYVRPLFPARMKMSRYVLGKFPGFTLQDAESRARRIERLVGKRVRIKIITPTLLSVDAA